MARGTKTSVQQKSPEVASKSDPDRETAKVGSDRTAARHFAGQRDFGIPAEGAGRFTEVAEEAKYQPGGDHLSDPRPPRSDSAGTRESGVGGVASGPGSSSGGDLDTDFVGVGTGTGLAEGGPDERTSGADMSDAGSDRLDPHPHVAKQTKRGTTVDRSGGDATTTGNGGGAGAMSTADVGDDAAAGEISQGEAGGDDNTDIDNLS